MADERYSGEIVPVNAYKLGWQPKWDQERMLASMDDEVQAVLDLDRFKPSVFGKGELSSN